MTLSIELIASEALKTSEIEGEILDRDSVQARHDLADLVALGALVRSGEYKATRYAVPFAIHGL